MKTPHLTNHAYEQLLTWIEDGTLPRGSITSEAALCRRLDMSRTPIRAAAQRLALEGYLRVVPKHGILILELSVHRTMDLLQLLAALLTYSVALLHGMRPDDLRACAAKALDACRDAASAEQGAARERDAYLAIVGLTENRELLEQLARTLSRLSWNANLKRWQDASRAETVLRLERLFEAVREPAAFHTEFAAYLAYMKQTWI